MTVDFSSMPDDTMTADGFDQAIIGVDSKGEQPVVKYDYNKCVAILVKDNNMSHESAMEWMDFNVVSANVGPGTPVFCYPDCEEDG